MQRAAVVIGILSLLSAGSVSAVGVYDGILPATDERPLPPAGRSVDVTVRVTVLQDQGAPAHATLAALENRGTLTAPDALRSRLAEGGVFTPVAIQGLRPPQGQVVLARGLDSMDPGQRVVVNGALELHYVLLEPADGHVSTVPVVLLIPETVHRPILFG